MTGRQKRWRLGVALAMSLGALWLGAAARGGQWPIPPVPDNAYAVVRPGQNPLVKPNSKVPPPTIVWEKVQVRKDHPRLWITRENKAEWVRRAKGHPSYELFQRAVETGDPLALALMYQITGRDAYARKAIEALLDGTAGATHAPFVFDWTYDAMTEVQRREAVERLWAIIQLDRASGWPRCSKYTSYPVDPRPSQTPPDQWPAFYNWTFHDQDWVRDQAPTFFALIALAHHHPRAEEGVRNFWEYSIKDATLFFDHLRDGSYWQGYYWWITAKIKQTHQMLTAMKTACGIDYTDPIKHPWLANVGRWLLYCSDPWRNRVIFNYGDGEMAPMDPRTRASLLASNSLVRDPRVQWLIDTGCPEARFWDDEILYHDPTVTPVAPSKLPPSRAFPGTNLVVMRSSWDANAVWASVRWMDWYDMHGHADCASFLIYCKSPVAPDTGFYDPGSFHRGNYGSRTIAHNTITVRDPKANLPLNDGCQRMKEQRTWSWAVGQAAWVYNQDAQDRGDLLAFQHHRLYDYCAGDATMAYRREHLKEFIRQCVFLRPGVFIVFDRVETTRPDLEKRWLMHLVGEPKIDGKLLRAEVKGHIEDYDGGLTVSRGSGGATLRCHTLLPAQRRLRRVGGAIPNVPTKLLCRVPRTRHRMGSGSRWLFTDPLILYYNDPITGTKRPAICFERDTPTDVEYEVTDKELYLKFDAYERGRITEVRFQLADFATLLELVCEIGRKSIWHVPLHYLPGYEYYNEGMNYAPAYRRGVWEAPRDTAAELFGSPNDHGSWRLEVYPAKPAARDVFLNVIQVLPADGAEIASVKLRDDADRAQVTVVVAGMIYTVAFDKAGKVAGHIRISDTEGKVLAEAPLAAKVVQKDAW